MLLKYKKVWYNEKKKGLCNMNNIVLENEFLKVEVSLLGAELKSIVSNKKVSYIWGSDPKFWNRSAPFLFPIVGTLKDKETYIEGKLYKMGSHGFLRDYLFEVVSKEKDKVVLKNEYNDETLSKYPFKYQALITYSLENKTLVTNIEIKNVDEKMMPFNLGGHPAFNCPLYEGESFNDYSICFEKEETFVSPFVEANATLNFSKTGCEYKNLKVLNLKKDLFDIDTIILPKVNSKKVKLLNKENKGIEFEFAKFSTFAIWTPFNEAPFVCLEPWIGYNDRVDSNKDFLTKDNLVKLEKNETFDVNYKISIID